MFLPSCQSITKYLLLVCLAAATASAQEAASAPPTMGFTDVIFGGGFVNTLIWLGLFLVQFSILPIGLTAFIRRKNSLALLAGGAGLAFIIGLLGSVAGFLRAFSSLATTTGEPKAQLLALAISSALWTTFFGLFIAAQYIILLIIAAITIKPDPPPNQP